MNILVIGNGFDLAHGLPTSYNDFLGFCSRVKNIYIDDKSIDIEKYEQKNLIDWEMDDYIKARLKKAYIDRKFIEEILNGETNISVSTSDKRLNELYSIIKNNAWLTYFFECPSYIGENWIDFEAEIARVIKSLDKARRLTQNGDSVMEITDESGTILMSILKSSRRTLQETYKDIREIDDFTSFLNKELDYLIRALEIYIADFVGNIPLKTRSLDIEEIKPDKILSFNYSETYEREYDENGIDYDYIHGRADVNNTLDTNDMVLGIDEYLPDDVKDKEVEFISFKKYYQRIHKNSKRLAENWCEKIKKEAVYEVNSKKFIMENQISYEMLSDEFKAPYTWEEFESLAAKYEKEHEQKHPRHNVYIFGHSLDVTDKDILRKLILNDNVYTTIFYCKKKDKKGKYDNGKKDRGQKIANLVKVIGQDELIKRTGGKNKTIDFVLQQDMIEKNIE